MSEKTPIEKQVQVVKREFPNLPLNHHSRVFVSKNQNDETVEWFQDAWGGFVLVKNYLAGGTIEYI
ncbi:hypothetical protein [Cohnella nanjingensis]|uniref:Uncharacterized protein n=1 Tax=Cohnella nanjingensis TaxID=1387779 RepID=A0A7X0RQ14_9BACL|nr:hypothetical protein [Cohnella nanjingensis]MBB6671353.1 hypothetical protein [Cohnella nanjingensis]